MVEPMVAIAIIREREKERRRLCTTGQSCTSYAARRCSVVQSALRRTSGHTFCDDRFKVSVWNWKVLSCVRFRHANLQMTATKDSNLIATEKRERESARKVRSDAKQIDDERVWESWREISSISFALSIDECAGVFALGRQTNSQTESKWAPNESRRGALFALSFSLPFARLICVDFVMLQLTSQTISSSLVLSFSSSVCVCPFHRAEVVFVAIASENNRKQQTSEQLICL